MVGCLWPQRGQLGSVFSFQCLRLSGVGRVSVLARRNNNCPAGRPCRILFHTWLESSSLQLSGSCFGQLVPLVSCHIFLSPFLWVPFSNGWPFLWVPFCNSWPFLWVPFCNGWPFLWVPFCNGWSFLWVPFCNGCSTIYWKWLKLKI